jgi:hypothetical protein
MTTVLGTAALKLAARGMRVFPCIPRQQKPAIEDNLNCATTDPSIITSWWRTRDFNIGIAVGEGSGVWVLDIDGLDGEAFLRQLEAEHGVLPPTVEVISGGGGRHLYFRWPSDIEVRYKQTNPLMPNIDVRGNGGYVVAPPSVHPCGRRYAWSVDSSNEFANAPEWLLELVTRGSHSNGGAAIATAPEAWRAFITDTYEGSHRGHAIARVAGLLLLRYVEPYVALTLCVQCNALHRAPHLERGSPPR